MLLRDRIKEFRRVASSEIRPSPRNWRTHPQGQRDALRGILAEVGIADANLVRELPDGTYELIDGHLRTAEYGPDNPVPVLVLDVTEEEADKLLATLDPLAAMAAADEAKLAELLGGLEFESEAIEKMLTDFSDSARNPNGDPLTSPSVSVAPDQSGDIAGGFAVLVECDSEGQQVELLTRLSAEGLRCRSLIS
jgi:ParB-like chromosome segregation protein Spo0J